MAPVVPGDGYLPPFVLRLVLSSIYGSSSRRFLRSSPAPCSYPSGAPPSTEHMHRSGILTSH